MHSQRLRETPLKPWLIAQKSGKVVAAHCNCVAGLGETCTHVSALMFYIDAKVRIRDSQTVTQVPAYWKLPSSVKDAAYLPVCQIDFTSAKTKKRQLDALVDGSLPSKYVPSKASKVPATTKTELDSLFEQLDKTGDKPAILSVIPEHCHQFQPTSLGSSFPPVLTSLYDPECCKLTYAELLKKGSEIQLSITQEQANSVEKATRMQSDCKQWFQFRSGRTTASKMKSVCRTNPDQPSKSLIQSVCYPESIKFSTEATRWGCSHEDAARSAYQEKMEATLQNFEIKKSGLVINTQFPHIGASPDGLVCCDCCGEGIVEIKCPFCANNHLIKDYATLPKACVDTDNDGKVTLCRNHAYYYQVQTQIHACEVDYADFVLWTSTDIHVERIEPNDNLWKEILERSQEFFIKAVLPELLGKYYTRSYMTHGDSGSSTSSSHCFCNKSKSCDHGDSMIACENKKCQIKWFHRSCIQLKRIPKGGWLCPECCKSRCNEN